MRVWDNADCATNYGRLGREVKNTMLCAGEDGKDACQVSTGMLLFTPCLKISDKKASVLLVGFFTSVGTTRGQGIIRVAVVVATFF